MLISSMLTSPSTCDNIMAEIELSVLNRQCLNRRIPDKETHEVPQLRT
jgi:hypothetical protein